LTFPIVGVSVSQNITHDECVMEGLVDQLSFERT
jgi:hypothetical protein